MVKSLTWKNQVWPPFHSCYKLHDPISQFNWAQTRNEIRDCPRFSPFSRQAEPGLLPRNPDNKGSGIHQFCLEIILYQFYLPAPCQSQLRKQLTFPQGELWDSLRPPPGCSFHLRAVRGYHAQCFVLLFCQHDPGEGNGWA